MFRGVRVVGVAVEADHAIPTRLFGYVERVVRRANQCIATCDAGMGPSGDAEARYSLHRAAVERACTCLDLFAHAFRESDGRVEHRSWQQQPELLATIAPNAIDLL